VATASTCLLPLADGLSHDRVTVASTSCSGLTQLDAQWLTYGEFAGRLGVSVEAARRRALRAKWSRQPGNDGAKRVRVSDDYVRPRVLTAHLMSALTPSRLPLTTPHW
jgi:hypothetical protein